VSKSDQIPADGIVEEVLPNAMFRVRLDQGPLILGHISGKMRKNKIQILEGDRVRMEMSPYDLTKGRIVFRER
jgi:translation initiation factor IF-1